MHRIQANRALVAAALLIFLCRPALPQGFAFGYGVGDLTQYNDVCVPALVPVEWDNTVKLTWDDGTPIKELLYPAPYSRVAWDDGTFVNWDDGTQVIEFERCGPPIPSTIVVWDNGTSIVWDNGTIISALGGYLPPISQTSVIWDNTKGTRVLWDDGTYITGF
jgi:hypothetical protein